MYYNISICGIKHVLCLELLPTRRKVTGLFRPTLITSRSARENIYALSGTGNFQSNRKSISGLCRAKIITPESGSVTDITRIKLLLFHVTSVSSKLN